MLIRRILSLCSRFQYITQSTCLMCLVTHSCLTLCDPVDCSPPGSSVCGDSLGKDTGVGCHALLVSYDYNQITVTQKPGSGRGQSPHVSKESTGYRAPDLQQSRRLLWHLSVANALLFACSSLSAPVLVLLLLSTARHEGMTQDEPIIVPWTQWLDSEVATLRRSPCPWPEGAIHSFIHSQFFFFNIKFSIQREALFWMLGKCSEQDRCNSSLCGVSMTGGRNREVGNKQVHESDDQWACEVLGRLQTVTTMSKANTEKREPGRCGRGPSAALTAGSSCPV